MDADFGEDGAAASQIRRACDHCRLRKIRCDKESPCHNCKLSNRVCSSTGLGQKPKEQRQRVLISTQYERKIDDMQARLVGIEALLRNLSVSSSVGTRAPSASASASPSDGTYGHRSASGQPADKTSPSSIASRGAESSRVPTSSYEEAAEVTETSDGGSSLAAQAAFASQLASQVIQTNMSMDAANPRMEAALNSLRQIASLHTARREHGGDELSKTGTATGTGIPAAVHRVRLRDLPLPPMNQVTKRLQGIKNGDVNMMMTVILSIANFEDFQDKCRQVYFWTEATDIPDALFITVNVGLLYLFLEDFVMAPPGVAKQPELEQSYSMCKTNVETAIGQVPLLMPATLDVIKGLLLATSFSVDMSRPTQAWLLVSRAAHVCRALGLHHESSMRGDPPEVRADKMLMFWTTYMMEKALSLRLGRASMLQDYDINIPSVLSSTYGPQPSTAYLSLWIKHAECQGRIYQMLYSPGALRQDPQSRADQVGLITRDVRSIVEESNKLLAQVKAASASAAAEDDDDGADYVALILTSDTVSYYSTMALAYRALPPHPGGSSRSRTFADECLDSAKEALEKHHEAMDAMTYTSMKLVYLHWAVLWAPFVPLIVIFCHVIETSSPDDLPVLDRFARSLEIESLFDVSPAIERLYRLSKVLYNVAVLYVEAKAQQAPDHELAFVGDEFDMYLSQLGFMPLDDASGGGGGGGALDTGIVHGGAGGGGGDIHMSDAQTALLGDWFSGGNYIMGLVEEDASTLNTWTW
ncbi:hypothetical protein BX600DRAFT_475521 [Xylariales sp. PMI_506]|nr:hypothetical protein BX600DRAFT_475521 [Xylariales sp. PMI_506]